jgi:Barrel-sandwich domain of CusB or HlyD membrane-fusion/GAF domain
MAAGSTRAVMVTGQPGSGPYDHALYWPNGTAGSEPLERMAQFALHQKQTVLKLRHNIVATTGEPLDALACPLFLKGQLLGAVAMELTHRSLQMLRASEHHLQNGAKWLETLLHLSDSTAKQQLVQLVQLVAMGLDHRQFKTAATEVANELADRLACRRVSLGFLHTGHIRVEALSHCSHIDPQSNLVRAIQAAMTEALDQGLTVVYPREASNSAQVSRFHGQLAETQHGAAICTLPLVKNGKAVGVLGLEREADKPFTPETVALCEQIGLLLGPVLETRRRDERSLAAKIFESLRDGCARLFGPGHLPMKAGVGLAVFLLAWLSLASGNFWVSCDAVLEAGLSRVIAAPQKGFIANADVRAGDLVRRGDRLATLDDHDLRLELRKWQSQLAQLNKEYRQAMARFDRAEIAILQAKQDQAEAQLHLVEQQLDRTTLVAPFDGMVIKGDLSQSLGSPVTPGQELFELAPTGQYRVVLKVDERDIGLVTSGQPGQLRLSGIPDLTIATRIDRLTPVSAVVDGRNCFRAEAVMDRPSDLMRPGMEGIAKIEIGKRKLIWIWTRRMVNWLQLFAWKRLPWGGP